MKIIIYKKLLRCTCESICFGILLYILLQCLNVRTYNHYVFVGHPVAELNDTNNVSSEIKFYLSNISHCRSYADYSIYTNNTHRRTDVLSPHFNNITDIINETGCSYNELCKKTIQKGLLIDSIVNLFTMTIFEEAEDLARIFNNDTIVNDNGVFYYNEYPMGAIRTIYNHDYAIKKLLEITKEKEAQHNSGKVFQYDNKNTIVKSDYALTYTGRSFDIIHKKNKSDNNLFLWIEKVFEPNDITKEMHTFVVHSESIDTVSLDIMFDEKIELSPINKAFTKINFNEIKFDDVTTLGETQYKVSSRYLHDNITRKNVNLRTDYYHLKAYENKISFWVKYVKSGKIQWFRLFVLTTLLGLLLTDTTVCIYNVLVELYKSISEKK